MQNLEQLQRKIEEPFADNMDENKSSISQAQSYSEIGEFWDTHDVTDYWEQTEAVEFEVNAVYWLFPA